MREKRKYVRLESELSFTFERKGPTGTLRGQGTTKNVSPAGLCFVTKQTLGVGEKIAVALTLPKIAQPISLEARVVWTRPFSEKAIPLYEVGAEILQTVSPGQNQFLLFVCDLMCERLERLKLL
ncbi:MAG: PilZ domain-containing protein [Candidatus Omnitrophica bacterium]|nr:PilZ domain-containing protein [Candidatus Omnitrophota bacterium]